MACLSCAVAVMALLTACSGGSGLSSADLLGKTFRIDSITQNGQPVPLASFLNTPNMVSARITLSSNDVVVDRLSANNMSLGQIGGNWSVLSGELNLTGGTLGNLVAVWDVDLSGNTLELRTTNVVITATLVSG